MELAYARASTSTQSFDRQVEAFAAAGVPRERIYLDKKSGAITDRPGLRALLYYARPVDVIVAPPGCTWRRRREMSVEPDRRRDSIECADRATETAAELGAALPCTADAGPGPGAGVQYRRR